MDTHPSGHPFQKWSLNSVGTVMRLIVSKVFKAAGLCAQIKLYVKPSQLSPLPLRAWVSAPQPVKHWPPEYRLFCLFYS